MRVLFWYCDRFAWNPTMQTLEDAPEPKAEQHEKVVVAFIHVEPGDMEAGNSSETKLVKNIKWLARKWEIRQVILHSFSHLGEEKAEPSLAKALLDRAQTRLQNADYETFQTPYGYFNDLELKAPGQPLARIYAVEDRIPRVYPWMNEPGGGIMPPWNTSRQRTVSTIFNTT